VAIPFITLVVRSGAAAWKKRGGLVWSKVGSHNHNYSTHRAGCSGLGQEEELSAAQGANLAGTGARPPSSPAADKLLPSIGHQLVTARFLRKRF